jgi:DNA polymerase I
VPRLGGQNARPTIDGSSVMIENLRAALAKRIEVEFDEQFKAMFSYKAKNYALVAREDEAVIKGGALKSRGPSCCLTA